MSDLHTAPVPPGGLPRTQKAPLMRKGVSSPKCPLTSSSYGNRGEDNQESGKRKLVHQVRAELQGHKFVALETLMQDYEQPRVEFGDRYNQFL